MNNLEIKIFANMAEASRCKTTQPAANMILKSLEIISGRDSFDNPSVYFIFEDDKGNTVTSLIADKTIHLISDILVRTKK